MELIVNVKRQDFRESESYEQKFLFATDDTGISVASLLSRLNSRNPLLDVNGEKARKINWESSCLQKKCGACAMRINGKPALACECRLSALDLRGGELTLEPLKKFPVVTDLVVDRSILYENLKNIRAWLKENVEIQEKQTEYLYEASRCIQCGCCLEICPNFCAGGEFYGMSAMVPVARMLEAMPSEDKKELLKKYKKHIYGGCGKSLACADVCPMGIDIEKLMVRSNEMSFWSLLNQTKILFPFFH